MKLREFDDTGWFATHEMVPRSIHAGGAFTLLPHQETAVREAESFVEDVLRDPRRPGGFGRMVLPPRTGKTVIATEIVARTGLAAVFVVPTRALVRQVHRVATAALPNVEVGIYSGEEDRLVEGGVHVTTYAALERRAQSRRLAGSVR